MSKHNYEVGGTCRYDGMNYFIRSWIHVADEGTWLYLSNTPITEPPSPRVNRRVHSSLVEGYEPPKKGPVVYEWLDADQFESIDGGRFTITNEGVNAKLTELYGAPPIVRTYNGEEAEEFGLDKEDYVLWHDGSDWTALRFARLEEGEHWMLQPPAPKEEMK